MSVLFSDTFELDSVDYDPEMKAKDKKFDKGTPAARSCPCGSLSPPTRRPLTLALYVLRDDYSLFLRSFAY